MVRMEYQLNDSQSGSHLEFVVSDQLGNAPDVALAKARELAEEAERSGKFRSAHGILYGLDPDGSVYIGQV